MRAELVAGESGAHSGGSSRAAAIALVLGLSLVFGGGAASWYVHTDGGRIRVEDVRFPGADGAQMSALLYVPPTATASTPAPAVLAIHGYINSRETQSGFAIEFARRGYVVLALDQTGHGYSSPPAFANGFGGPDGLRYLRSLDFVDPRNIGLEGHSMGGWAALMAAQAYPEDYRSIALVGSSSGTLGAPPGDAVFPRNLSLIFSIWDEFSGFMWESPVASEIGETEKLQKQFGSEGRPVEVGRLYGSIENGTARLLRQPRATHPQDHLSAEAIGDAVEWMQRTLRGGAPLPVSDQVWYWKEAATGIAFLGMVVALLALGDLLLRRRAFAPLREAPGRARGARGLSWALGALVLLVVPVSTYFWLNNWAETLIGTSRLFPQNITTGIMLWALGNALVALVGFALFRVTSGREQRGTGADYGLRWEGLPWIRGAVTSLLFAGVLVGFAYGLLWLSQWLFLSDFRFWVVALKPMSELQFQIFLRYLLPFAVFFLALGLTLHAQLRGVESGLGRDLFRNVVLLTAGFAVLLGVQYVPLLRGGELPMGEPLLTIVAIQFLPLLGLIAVISTFFFHRTGSLYPGAWVNAFLVTWYIVAGQATHIAL